MTSSKIRIATFFGAAVDWLAREGAQALSTVEAVTDSRAARKFVYKDMLMIQFQMKDECGGPPAGTPNRLR